MNNQRHFLFVWELGSDLGHFTTLIPVMSVLLERGHKVSFITRNIEDAANIGLSEDIALYQAPLWHRGGRKSRMTCSQADILLDMGYDSTKGLSYMLRSWRRFYDLLQPDMVIYNYAPTAMLAWYDLDVPKVLLGNAFYSPAPGKRSLNLCYWNDGSNDIDDVDHRFIENVGRVLSQKKSRFLNQPSDIFKVDQAFFLGFPEFDIYRYQRDVGVYFSHFGELNSWANPDWPKVAGKKVFAYLKAGQRHVSAVLESLASTPDINVLCYYSGNREDVMEWQSDNVNIVASPVSMPAVLEQAELVICHGGAGTVFESLQAGVPLVLIPIQLEQIHHSITVDSLGLGVAIKTVDTPDIVRKKIEYAVRDGSILDNAARFSRSKPMDVIKDPANFIAAWCEEELKRVASPTFFERSK
jgi:glycosyl transferase family 28